MSADNKNRTATFWGDGGDVKVLHVPWDKSQATQEINFNNTVDNMPPGGLYLRCDRLTVYSRLDNTRKGQKLDAIGRITVKARDTKGKEFWGNADVVHFDEEKDQVIFEGVEGGKARLFVRDAKGAPPIPVVGKKIIYLRSKGEYIADGVTSIQGSN
jgi:lipopolysaccharide export system protein LptA